MVPVLAFQTLMELSVTAVRTYWSSLVQDTMDTLASGLGKSELNKLQNKNTAFCVIFSSTHQASRMKCALQTMEFFTFYTKVAGCTFQLTFVE